MLCLLSGSYLESVLGVNCGRICYTHPFAQLLKDVDLNQSLLMEPLLVTDDLDGHGLARAVITAVKHLAERAFAEGIDNLISVREMIVCDDLVVAAIVIVPVVVV